MNACTLIYIHTTAQPPLVECGSISELIEERMCDCSCIEIKGLAGMKPMKGPKKDSCPACNMACNDEMPTGTYLLCLGVHMHAQARYTVMCLCVCVCSQRSMKSASKSL